jgi:hypothetical protein
MRVINRYMAASRIWMFSELQYKSTKLIPGVLFFFKKSEKIFFHRITVPSFMIPASLPSACSSISSIVVITGACYFAMRHGTKRVCLSHGGALTAIRVS